jgi:transposase-like protein
MPAIPGRATADLAGLRLSLETSDLNDTIYSIAYLDCIHLRVREGAVRTKTVYLAIGTTMQGEKKVPGLWLTQTKGAQFWLQLATKLRNCGAPVL